MTILPYFTRADIEAPYGTGTKYSYDRSTQVLTREDSGGSEAAANTAITFAGGTEVGVCAEVSDTSTLFYMALDDDTTGMGLALRLLFFGFGGTNGGGSIDPLEYELWVNGVRRVETGILAKVGDYVCIRRTDTQVEFWLNGEHIDNSNANWEFAFTNAVFGRWAVYNNADTIDRPNVVGGDSRYDKFNSGMQIGSGMTIGNGMTF